VTRADYFPADPNGIHNRAYVLPTHTACNYGTSRRGSNAGKATAMFSPEQYRARADEYTERAKSATSPKEREEFQNLQRSFAVMADNEQWLADNHDQTVHASAVARTFMGELVAEDAHVMRCLGAALIMEWNSFPTSAKRKLFENASAMALALDVGPLRSKIARLLHEHNGDSSETADIPPPAFADTQQ
jgi:hypothetical protein